MAIISNSRFINFWRKHYQKFENLSLFKQLSIIFVLIIIIWQAVCFVQGAITAKAMNYYCEKEAGIKLAEGTYLMQIPKDEYKANCDNTDTKAFYCFGSKEAKEEWIKVDGSVKRDFSFGPRTDQNLPGYIRYDIGGLRKRTVYEFNSKKQLVYTEINFTPNASMMFLDSFAYNLFKNHYSGFEGDVACGFSKIDNDYRNSVNGLLVNKN